jgi:hypothetical protein
VIEFDFVELNKYKILEDNNYTKMRGIFILAKQIRGYLVLGVLAMKVLPG